MLVIQTPMDNMSKDKPSTSIKHVDYESMLNSFVRSGTCGHIHAQETGWQSGMLSCSVAGLSTYLMQKSTITCMKTPALKQSIGSSIKKCSGMICFSFSLEM